MRIDFFMGVGVGACGEVKPPEQVFFEIRMVVWGCGFFVAGAVMVRGCSAGRSQTDATGWVWRSWRWWDCGMRGREFGEKGTVVLLRFSVSDGHRPTLQG